jgi:hypothetical protein
MLENLSAQVTILDADGQSLGSAQAYSPLDILPPGASLPLMVFYPPAIPANAQPRAQMLTGIRLLPDDPRYLPVTAQNTLVQVDSSGRSAQVSGRVHLLDEAESASSIWVAAVAYNEQGRVVGVRRWKSESGGMQFEFDVSSLAGRIESVEFVVEARP